MTTGGGLVFGGDANGRFKALDDKTGQVLWEINLGSAVTGFPISYAVDGNSTLWLVPALVEIRFHFLL